MSRRGPTPPGPRCRRILGGYARRPPGLSPAAGPPQAPPRTGSVRIQLLGASDLHGHLQPGAGSAGAARFAADLDRAAGRHPGRTIRVHAGDMVGASPLISSHFRHESTIDAINRMDFDVGTVGNHEFDNGGEELTRLLRRARFPYISANVVDRQSKLRLPRYRIIERAGVRIGSSASPPIPRRATCYPATHAASASSTCPTP